MKRTPATPTLSDAVAATVTVPVTGASVDGAVTLTAGGVVSAVDPTVTVTPADVVMFPDVSRATAPSTCDPRLAVEVVHTHDATPCGAVTSGLTVAPSSVNQTPPIATLSDAFANTVTVPETVAPLAGELMATVGGVLSTWLLFATVTSTGAAETGLPALSRATAVTVWTPSVTPRVSQETVQAPAVISGPTGRPETSNWRLANPAASA